MNINEYAFRLEVQLAIVKILMVLDDQHYSKDDVRAELLTILHGMNETQLMIGEEEGMS